ncbi:hypothetical protein CRE_13289 [Caenorhabditis remanei]|nr:hypothetical protein CRE_13289 [Caenorhabditis remanei]
MKPRRAPVIVKALDEGFQRPFVETDPYDDIQLEKVLKELSFIRIKLDQIVLPDINPFIQRLHNFREFFGFQLEYSFPCLDVVSKSLKTTVRIPEKEVDVMKIVFNHRRIVLLDMHQDQIEQWQKAQLTIHLLVNMSVNGRHTTRPLAKCHVRLSDLIFPPYIIHRDFDFVGEEFEGTAEIRIDLGSRVKSLMEKLNNLRGDRSLEDTFVVTEKSVGRRTRSRSSSRCRAHSSASSSGAPKAPSVGSRRPHSATSSVETPILTQRQQFFGENFNGNQSLNRQNPNSTQNAPPRNELLRPRINSNSSIGSDSVFVRPTAEHPRVLEDMEIPESSRPRERITRTVTESYGASTVGDTVEEVTRHGGKYYMEVTVHEAIGLPPVEDESGRITSPSSYVSILGRDGDLRSPVFRNSRDPRWNFVARFAISSERRNLVIKVNHRGVVGDSALGYVTIPLPTTNVRKSVYEMTDVTRMAVKYTSQVPMLTISLEKIRNIDDVEGYEDYENHHRTFSRRTTSSRSTQSSPTRPAPPVVRIESPPILESSEVIKERMQRCMADLESMMRGMNT